MSGLDKMKDKAEQLKGKAKQAAGRETGDPALEDEGTRDEMRGDVKEAGHTVRDKARDVADDLKRD